MRKIKFVFASVISVAFAGLAAVVFLFIISAANLPRLITLEDYKPLVVSEIYAKDGKKVGEFFREKRIVIPYSRIPNKLVKAFISAEDSSFFTHGGINLVAITRATIANIKAGHTVQGGSTITQQVAKSLMLSPEKTLMRKIKEAILAFRMEKNLKKEEILFLYLNQIYLGHGAYGVQAAAQNYYRKNVEDLTLAEMAMLAGLPQAPGKYSPILEPLKAKERQLYVLRRMVEEGYITDPEHKAAAIEPVKVYYREAFEDVAPFYKETIRQFLKTRLGEEKILNEGVKIHTAMDFEKQLSAQKAIEKNLRDLDKRQGFRGAAKNLKSAEEIAQFLVKVRDDLIRDKIPYRVVSADPRDFMKKPLDLTRKPGQKNLPDYLFVGEITDGVVTKVDSQMGLVYIRLGETQGLIDIDTMGWSRKPDTTKLPAEDVIKDPALVLNVGDVIEVKVESEIFYSKRLEQMQAQQPKGKKSTSLIPFKEYLGLTLEQKPIVQGALLSFDLETSDVLSMVGGLDFSENKYNRTLQATRQTGSAFKAFIYAAALDKGFTSASTIIDSPIVYEEGEGQESKKWKPDNFEKKFTGDVLFRTAFIKSLNIPTVKVLEKVGLEWVSHYSQRLGIFSPLNLDYTMALGSSGITLFEMTKAFSVFAKSGKRIHPIIVKKVTDSAGKEILAENISLDEKFKTELENLDKAFETWVNPPEASPNPTAAPTPNALSELFKFSDTDQVISPQTAYLMTHLLKGVVQEGTGVRAKALGRPTAGKTGTTNGYYDAWFVGYTPQIATGVWVGFDEEKPIGRLETGASAALPIWVEYMIEAVKEKPAIDFAVPPGIVFANIDAQTGRLGSAKTKKVVREAFKEGLEPTESSTETPDSEEKNFFKEDLSQ